jgi:mRNA-degrading endonuclease YafQ of YafQ-DinJ toxin-antitoxin module
METWLPYPNFIQSAKSLDTMDLWRQRHDAMKVIETLTNTSLTMTYRNHPLVAMWRGAEYTLGAYGLIMCHEWQSRGHTDEMTDKFTAFLHDALRSGGLPIQGHNGIPWWLGLNDFHCSQQAALVQKDKEHYGKQWPALDPLYFSMPRIWPAEKSTVPRGPHHYRFLYDIEKVIATEKG